MNNYDLQKAKDGIISYIQNNGPSLPAVISSHMKIPMLFISAFLSELYREEKVVMSHMKVGTTSLYLLKGQEKQLENFIDHLNQREREALSILRSKTTVKDNELAPVHRVAIKEIKDFAIPIHNGNEIIWQYAFSDIKENKIDNPVPIAQIVPAVKVEESKVEEKIEQKQKKPRARKTQEQENKSNFSLSLASVEQTTPLSEEVKSFLEKNNYLVHNLIKADKKECMFKVSISGPHGNQSYLVFAKDKKKIKEDEIQSFLQEAHNQRQLCLILARGEPDKKTESFISSWSNFVSYKTF